MSKLTAKVARERMVLAREDEAGKLLAREKVAALIGTAAGQGLGLVLIGPPPGVSIKATERAAELVATLTAAGFRVGWRDRRDPGDVPNHELAIEWDTAAVTG